MADLRVCAGIVTYNSDIDILKKNISAVSKQVERIYIFDNASTNIDEIASVASSDKIMLVKSETNYGIAKALNELCKIAILSGFEWMLTLDHDTVICDGFIESCANLLSICELNAAIVCPRVIYVGINEKEKGDVDTPYTAVPACMTSGSFMSLKAWETVGGFDEYMVIDWVDNDICTNFIIHGYSIIRNNSIFMEHRLGNPIKRKFLFFTITDYQYSAFRIYYIVRNGIYYRKKYGKHINQCKIALINIMTRMKFRILYRKDKEKIDSITRAVKDSRKICGVN